MNLQSSIEELKGLGPKSAEKFPIGTKVTLIGQEGDKAISATDLAQKRGTINYEVLCLLSDRIPRFYSK